MGYHFKKTDGKEKIAPTALGPQSLISALGNFSTSVADHGFVNAALAHMATYNLGTGTVRTQCEIAYLAHEI